MPVYKNEQRNSWYVSFYYTDWNGNRKKKKKEGLATKKDALAFERNFLEQTSNQCTMRFEAFVKIYLDNCQKRIKTSTYTTKSTIIKKHILPFFKTMRINEIKSVNICQWQSWLLKNDKIKTQQYLHYINVQLSGIFNFARRYYGLTVNPVKQCETIGNTKSIPKIFWTLKEFNIFIDNIDKKDKLYVMFNLLFWTGIRRGELLALRPIDFDFRKNLMMIRRNLVYIKGKPQINTPKTNSSFRVINVPKFLMYMVKTYITAENITDEQILFDFIPKKILQAIKDYSKKAGLNPIKIHDFRHAHASLLIEQGFSPMIIAERLGHKDINTTLRIYAHLYPNKQRILAKELDKLYQKNKK